MIETLKERLAEGPLETTLLAVGASAQLTLKVKIFEADATGIVCQTKGMMGGYGDMQLRPWSSIGLVNLP